MIYGCGTLHGDFGVLKFGTPPSPPASIGEIPQQDQAGAPGPGPGRDPPPLVIIRPAGIYASELVVTDPGHGYQQAIPLSEETMLNMQLDLSAGLSRLAAQRRANQRSNPPCAPTA